MPRQLSNTTNRSMFAANALRRRRRLLAKLEQLGSDFPHRRGSERDTASEPPQVSRVPDLSSAHKVGETDAGKVVYFEVSHLERVATPQQIGVGKGSDCNVDPLAAMGPTGKTLVRVLAGMTDSRPQAVAIRGRSERAPGVAHEATALERTERHIASSQSVPNEIGVQIEVWITGRLEEFLGRHDSHGDSAWKVRLGELRGQRSHVYPVDVKAGVSPQR